MPHAEGDARRREGGAGLLRRAETPPTPWDVAPPRSTAPTETRWHMTSAGRDQLVARAGPADEHPGHPERCGRAGSLEPRLRARKFEIRGQQPSRRRRHSEPVPIVVPEVAATPRPARPAVSARGVPAGCFRLRAPTALVPRTGRAQPAHARAGDSPAATAPAPPPDHQRADAELSRGSSDRRAGG